MTRFDKAFTTLSQHMAQGALPLNPAPTPVPLASLIARVDAARSRYVPEAMPR